LARLRRAYVYAPELSALNEVEHVLLAAAELSRNVAHAQGSPVSEVETEEREFELLRVRHGWLFAFAGLGARHCLARQSCRVRGAKDRLFMRRSSAREMRLPFKTS